MIIIYSEHGNTTAQQHWDNYWTTYTGILNNLKSAFNINGKIVIKDLIYDYKPDEEHPELEKHQPDIGAIEYISFSPPIPEVVSWSRAGDTFTINLKNIAKATDKINSGYLFDIKGFRVDRVVVMDGDTIGSVPGYKILEYGKAGYSRTSDVITFIDNNITDGVSYTYRIYSYDFDSPENISEPLEITVP